ncbi:MAG: hypothetical protein JST73_10710 [Actinobacteria bacterium]|nr:hypothetical protein [Actinomycetota bacterium]
MTDQDLQDAPSDATVLIGYPSAIAPGLPAFTFKIPEGWHVGEFPGALLAAAAPEIEGEFRPNVVVQGRRVADSITLDEAADEAVDELRAIYGDVAIGDRATDAEGAAELLQQPLGYRLPDDGPTMAHLNVLVMLHDEIAPGAFRSLLGINAVCTQDQVAEYLPVFQAMIASFAVERRVLDLSESS